jgi:hypothetical protein
MKNIFFALLILTTTVMFAGCGPTISGKDDESFKASRTKMEEKLNNAQKTDLEKAIRRGKIELPRALEEINKKIQELNVELKERESRKGKLDEFELTN